MKATRIVSIACLITIILNLILFSFGKISATLFWIVIIIIALIAYLGIPYLQKRSK